MAGFFVLLQRLVPQHLLSRLIGVIANSRLGFIKRPFIHLFIRAYGVNMAEALRPEEDYACFNDFFTRALKDGARPVSGTISSPADGAISQLGHIDGNQLLQAKGVTYSLEKLLGESATRFHNGSFATIYLSPKDYHRVHMPIAGDLQRARYIPGRLFSVNAATTLRVPDLFAVNERLVLWFETHLGPFVVIMVGAMIVAGIRPVWRDAAYEPGVIQDEVFNTPMPFQQGQELGQFELGSTAIIVSSVPLDFCGGPGDTIRMGEPLVNNS